MTGPTQARLKAPEPGPRPFDSLMLARGWVWALIGVLMSACVSLPPSRTSYVYRQVHMGMEVRMVLHAPDEVAARRAGLAAFAVIAALDQRLSDYRDTSDLRAIERAAPDPLRVDPDVLAVIKRALQVAEASDGAFDPTIAPLVALWRQSRQSGRLPSDAQIAAARRLVGWARVELDVRNGTVRLPEPGMRLDLGGIAKGYILQQALATLREHGVTVAMLEAGGDIVAGDTPRGSDGWRVQVSAECGLRGAFSSEPPGFSPPDAHLLRRETLATSGATAQFVEINGTRYSHIVDPRTGLGLTNHHTVHVRAADGATSDAWATALSVLGPERAKTIAVPAGVTFCFSTRDFGTSELRDLVTPSAHPTAR